jgi:hypothetical protein
MLRECEREREGERDFKIHTKTKIYIDKERVKDKDIFRDRRQTER